MTLTSASVLERIKHRGSIRVGTSLGFYGLSSYDEDSGEWIGFDTDIARAIAVAILGDAGAVEFVPLASSERFEALDKGHIDLGSYNSSITYYREAEHDATFIHPILYDGEIFATRRENLSHKKGVGSSIQDAKSVSIGMLSGSTTADNVSQYCGKKNVQYVPRLYATPQEALAGYISGEVDIYCLDSYLLAGELSRKGEIEDHIFLNDQVSLEAMSPVARSSDWKFAKAIRWTLFAIIEADNLGLTQGSAPFTDESALSPYVRKFLRPTTLSVEKLGLRPNFTSSVIEKVGSYSDIFERNLGMRSTLKQQRKANHLRTRGGMLYAPLFI
jgi:polar amino acid transport system substrate-binding protein